MAPPTPQPCFFFFTVACVSKPSERKKLPGDPRIKTSRSDVASPTKAGDSHLLTWIQHG